MTGRRIELLLELASRHGEDLGERHEAALEPRWRLLDEQLFGRDGTHIAGEHRRAHRERRPPRRHLDALGVQKVQPAAVRTGLRPPLLQEFGPLPERFTESQHDLEHLPHLETRQRPLFCRQRGVESYDAGLEDGERQRDQHGAGAQRR